jgi:hypothetical protein
MDFMILFQKVKTLHILQMNKALDYVSMSKSNKVYQFYLKPIALRLFISKDVRNANFGKFCNHF